MPYSRADHECPNCGHRLLAIGFCMHVDQHGNCIEVFDAVPAGTGETLAARSARFDHAISQPAPNQIGA